MTYKIVPEESRTFTTEDIVDSVSANNGSGHVYYVFLGKHTQYAVNNDNPKNPIDSEKYKRQVYNDMLFGKKLNAGDVKPMVLRNDYVSNTVYDMYDDTDNSLYSKTFYVTVDRSAEKDVFKCLDNRNGSNSVFPPNKEEIESFDQIYRTADGYVWKYMYTIPYADVQKFATEQYIPVVPNTEVTEAANNGSIDVIIVENPGERYDNYLYGTLGKNDLNIEGNPKKIDVSGNNKSSTVDDFYGGCIFKVVSGTGTGSYTRIESYDVYANNRVVTLKDSLSLDLTSEYEITPRVVITGDYTQTVNAEARAIINSVANTIDYVEVLNKGLDYRQATAYVYASPVVSVTEATVRPIIGPFGGHGFDANNELGSTRACFSVTFDETSDLLPSINDFRQVGLISNPLFSNVVVNFSEKGAASFLSGETVYQINPIRMFANAVSINTSSNSITASVAYFNELEANTILYIEGSSSKQLATVVGITNSTVITIDTPGNFACNDCKIYLANVSNPTAVINDLYEGVALTEVSKAYGSGVTLVGYDSGASGVVNNMEVNDKSTNLSTFTQMWRYVVNTTDTFDPEEDYDGIIYQPDSFANSQGRLFGVVDDGANTVMYLTNQVGYINTGENVLLADSQKSAYVATSYEPEITYTSGRIIYLENLEKVARNEDQKETFKIIFSY